MTRRRSRTVTLEVEADLPPEAVAALQAGRWRRGADGRARLVTTVEAEDAGAVVAALEGFLGVRADWARTPRPPRAAHRSLRRRSPAMHRR